MKSLTEFAFVRAVTPLQPAYKIEPVLLAPLGLQTIRIHIDKVDDSDNVVARLSEFGEILGEPSVMSTRIIVRMRCDTKIVPEIAAIPEVLVVGLRTEPQKHDEMQDEIMAMKLGGSGLPVTGYREFLESIGLTGQGVAVCVCDTGVDTGTDYESMHPDLRGRVIDVIDYAGNSGRDDDGHGTHCAGIVAGNGASNVTDGDGFEVGLGIAPEAQIVTQNYLASYSDEPVTGLLGSAYQCGAQVHSNSWGEGYYSDKGYTSYCIEWDEAMLDIMPNSEGTQRIIVVKSAGNDGDYGISSPGEAKNTIAVGATQNYRPEKGCTDINSLADFSSRGMCEDGRIKPDICCPGECIISALSSESYPGWCYGSYGNLHEYCSGTSMSCPAAAGSAALLVEKIRNETERVPSPALVRAFMVVSALDMPDPSDSPIPNEDEGWGRIDLSKMLDPDAEILYYDEEVAFAETGQYYEMTVSAASMEEPMKIAVAWTDPPGALHAMPALVNDLDLIVTDGSGAQYLGNKFSGGFSVPGGSADRKDNIECVFIQQPQSQYTIRIVAHQISSDSTPGTGGIQQPFALLIENGIDISSRGWIRFSANMYRCDAEVEVTLADIDLAGESSVEIMASSTYASDEWLDVTLYPSGDREGLFRGSFLLTPADEPTHDAVRIAHNYFIGAVYTDHDDGMGGTDVPRICYAQADCEGPMLQMIDITQSESGRVRFHIGANEPCSVRIGYWDAAAEIKYIESVSASSNVHGMEIMDLLFPCTKYWSAIELVDPYGNSTTWDNEGQFFDFETKYYGTTAYSGGEVGDEDGWYSEASRGELWQRSSRRVCSGASSWYCGNEASGSYGNSWDTSLYSDEFLVAPDAKLSFAIYYATERSYDYLKVYVQLDGHDTLLSGMSYSGSSGSWSIKETSLSYYEGETIRLRFRFTSDSYTTGEGCYIDNCSVTAEGDCKGGVLITDKPGYTCSQMVYLTLLDSDLGQDTLVSEGVNIKYGNAQTGVEAELTLHEVANDAPRFSGTLQLSSDGAPGTLQVGHGNTIWFAYVDPYQSGDEPQTVLATAYIDCEAPQITSYEYGCLSPEVGVIRFETDTRSRTILHFLGIDNTAIAQDIESFSTKHEIVISGLEECTVYQFYLELWDEVGNYSLLNNDGINYELETPRERVVLDDDCENGEGDWVHQSLYGIDQWHLSNRRSSSGSTSWFCGAESGDYADSMECALVLENLEWLPGASLTFQTYYSLESGYDYGYIEVKNPDFSSWKTLETVNGYSNQWESITVALPNFGNAESSLRFRLDTDSNTNYEGWYVDDVKIKGLWDCHSGVIRLDREMVGCTCTELYIELIDLDLNQNPEQMEMVDVIVNSEEAEDSITTTLNEVSRNSSKFTGKICVTDQDKHAANDTIRVTDGDLIVVSYYDETHGTEREPLWVIETVTCDCARPEVVRFNLVPFGASDALASCTISRPVDCTFSYESLDSGELMNITVGGPKKNFAVRVNDLVKCADYHFTIEMLDEVGNHVMIDSESPEYFYTFGSPWNEYTTGFADGSPWTKMSLKPVYRSEEDVWKWNELGGNDAEAGHFYADIPADVESIDAALVSPPMWTSGPLTITFSESHSSPSVDVIVEASALPDGDWVDITPFDITSLLRYKWHEVSTIFSSNSEKCRFRIRVKTDTGAPASLVMIDSFKVMNDIGCDPNLEIFCNDFEFRANSTINLALRASPGNIIGNYFLTAALVSSDGKLHYYPSWNSMPDFIPLDFSHDGPLSMTLVDHRIYSLADAIGLQGYWLIEGQLFDEAGTPVSSPSQKGFLVLPQVDLPPRCSLAVSPVAASENELVVYDASSSYDDVTPGGALLYRWDIDSDGTWDSDFGQAAIMEIRYEYAGAYEVAVEVMDSVGQTDVSAQGVYVY
ncbi:MAG: S8 family serine peptidase [Candidatus Coatesbacteria bacterium]|nr:S8 family serine peptidase [Candidatus Coatesbacteria bacterium]